VGCGDFEVRSAYFDRKRDGADSIFPTENVIAASYNYVVITASIREAVIRGDEIV